jgi:toxin FitB
VADYADRILGFDLDCAQLWGRLMSHGPQHPIDKQIAAIALIHDLTLVTRNTADFTSSGVRTLNPFILPELPYAHNSNRVGFAPSPLVGEGGGEGE